MKLRQLIERGDRPFLLQPQVERYFPASSPEDARRRVTRAVGRGEGPGVVIGAAGTGKSLLLQVLAAAHQERFDIVLLACAQLCTRRALLQAIHFELGLEYRRRDEGQLRLSLLDQLLSNDQPVHGLLLLVDEAQTLPIHLLEELRILTNLSRQGMPRVRLVLAGLPALEEKLASPEMESLSQRLATRCYLTPLTRQETAQYVGSQLKASGLHPDSLFAANAYDALFNATDGVPRLVNQVCDRAMILANAQHLGQVDASAIQAAWADLQQLPAPWNASNDLTPSAASDAGVLEFGSLDESVAAPHTSEAFEHSVPEAASEAHIHETQLAEELAIEEPLEPTELDFDDVDADAASPAPAPDAVSKATRRAKSRVFSGPAPDAVDPFADDFAEEELVLDTFAAISGMFHAHTPRVENRREPAFARLVQHALDATAAAIDDGVEVDVVDESPADESATESPTIRLADWSGAANASFESECETSAQASNITAFDGSSEPAHVAPIDANSEVFGEADEAILVIEDESTFEEPPKSGVRREEYRHLFSRLRHGT